MILFVLQITVGAVVGYAMGKIAPWLINQLRLGHEGLYPVLTLSLAMLTYGLSSIVHGNGFLAVYIAGLMLGNQISSTRGVFCASTTASPGSCRS